MNDFTKEDLEFILDGTRHWSNKNIPTPWVFEFKKKGTFFKVTLIFEFVIQQPEVWNAVKNSNT